MAFRACFFDWLNGFVPEDVRQHWAIENNGHWPLEMLFNEDESRVGKRALANN